MTKNNKKDRPGTEQFYNQIEYAFRLITPKDMLDFYEERIKGQDEVLKMAVFSVYKFLEAIAKGESTPADNWVLTAPSGSGKTEFFRTTKAYFKQRKIPVPVVQIDLSLLTEEGFKGENPTIIPLKILTENPDCGGTAICFFDEADKKFVPSYTSYGNDANAAVQANLLTLTEGIFQVIPVDENTVYEFDSERTMFVFLGAFQSLRKEKLEAKQKKATAIGFGAPCDPDQEKEEDSDVFYADLELDDFIRYGMMDELAGRITFVLNFHKLSEKEMSNLILCKTKEISDSTGIRIQLTQQGLQALLKIAFGSLGVRAPMNQIKKLSQTTAAQVFFDKGFDYHRDCIIIDGIDSAYIIKKTDCSRLIGTAMTASH